MSSPSLPSPVPSRALSLKSPPGRPTYSICTVVTRPSEYAEMCASFAAHGFSPEDTEYLHIDNSQGNVADAFSAYNAFLTEAKSPYTILCHQDVLLLEDDRVRLDAIIAELHALDPRWGLFGNSGPKPDGKLATRITDPHLPNWNTGGPFPVRVVNLDENFIVVRRDANLAVSHDLEGFHLYGPDLCMIAEILGLHAYVVDFHLLHKSHGNKDETFFQSRLAFRRKYDRAFRSRWLQIPTLCPMFVSGTLPVSLAARALRKFGFWPRLNDPPPLPQDAAAAAHPGP